MCTPLSVEYTHDRVLGEPQLVEEVQHLPDALVVLDHGVVVLRLPVPGLALALRFDMGAEVHVRRVEPHEERRLRLDRVPDEALGRVDELLVDRLHPLLRQRTGVLDAAVGVAVDHPTRAELLPEVRELLRVG